MRRIEYRDLVDDDADYWYYDEKTGLLLHYRPSHGWGAMTPEQAIRDQLRELREAVAAMDEHGYHNDNAFERLLAYEDSLNAR